MEAAVWDAFDDEPETEVLLEDYRDFQDTVVDSAIGFDPGAFSSASDDAIGISTPSGVRQVQQEQAHRQVQQAQPASTPQPARQSDRQSQFASPAPARQTAAPTLLPAPGVLGDAARPNRGFKVAIAILATVAVAAAVACLVVLLAPAKPTASQDAAAPAKAVTPVAAAPVVAGGDGDEEAKDASTQSAQEDEADFAELSGEVASDGSDAHGGDLGNTRAPAGSLTEADAYQILLEHYQKISSYDKRIAECATDFNAHYAEKSKQTRSSKASIASRLASQIESDWDELEDIVLPPLCRNTSAWEALVECYEYLWNRIDTINDGWEASLSYDDPAKHKEEILAPIKADQGSDGQSRNYTSFKKAYSAISLVKP